MHEKLFKRLLTENKISALDLNDITIFLKFVPFENYKISKE